jgi:hypothetical protein
VYERTCAGLAMTAAYWALPVPSQSDPGAEPVDEFGSAGPSLAQVAAAAALNVRCAHPTQLPPRPRTPRGRATR